MKFFERFSSKKLSESKPLESMAVSKEIIPVTLPDDKRFLSKEKCRLEERCLQLAYELETLDRLMRVGVTGGDRGATLPGFEDVGKLWWKEFRTAGSRYDVLGSFRRYHNNEDHRGHFHSSLESAHSREALNKLDDELNLHERRMREIEDFLVTRLKDHHPDIEEQIEKARQPYYLRR